MDREVVRERVRASRRGIPFCIVTVTLLTPKRKASRQVARILLRNLRQTDHKGMLGLAEFSILLTDTPHAAGATVVRRLQSLFSEHGLFVRLELKVHEPPNYDPPTDDDHWDHREDRQHEHVADMHISDRRNERRELVSRTAASAFDGDDDYVSVKIH